MTMIQDQPVSAHRQGRVRVQLANPPVAETSIGFYFQKIEGWHLLHQGLLWASFRNDYPNPPEFFAPIIEPPPQTNVGLLVGLPIMRTGFSNSDKTQLVQIQDGLLVHNWKKAPGLPEYMQYEQVRVKLQQDWATFRHYLRDQNLKQPSVTRCEMTYFNHLVRGTDWTDLSVLADTFTVWRALPASASSGTIQLAAFNVQYQLPSGVVHLSVQPAIRATDGKEIIQFAFTSVVSPKRSDDNELFGSLDECHDNAQRAFLDFTTEKARERWNKK